MSSLKLKNFAFTKHVAPERNGARVLGFVGFTLICEGHEFTYSDLKVRVNTSGEHTLCAPSRRYKNRDGEWRTSSAYRFDDPTYAALRDAIYATPAVISALGEHVEEEIEVYA
ncbi:MAG: hypothetical protein V3T23_09825 [Nitrososphaerales archaeon]